LNEASKKFDPGRELAEAALEGHLRAVSFRNGRSATLFLAVFAAVLWPTDLVVFRGMPEVLATLAWSRVFIIAILLVVAGLLRTRLGPRRPSLILCLGGVLILFVIGWGLGRLGGAEKPWIHLSYPAMFFSMLAPVQLRERVLLVIGLAGALLAGFLGMHPEHHADPMVPVMVSFAASMAALVAAVGHLSFRILKQSFYQSVALERASRELADLNETLESRVRAQTGDLRRLTDHLERAREDERTRIARELHDELGQELTALNLTLALARKRFERDPKSIGGNLVELEALLQRTRVTTRNLITELRPRMLDELGLPAALEWLARETGQRSGVRCRLEAENLDGLPVEITTVAFRIVQEALTNVMRHAGARTAVVAVAARDGQLVLTVTDDGIGLGPAQGGSGFGLIGIRERVRNLDGRVEIESRPGAGTTLTVRLPLPRARAEAAS
jgi:signal transduction histidine kinase